MKKLTCITTEVATGRVYISVEFILTGKYNKGIERNG
jgi:hypothetical protein